MSDERPTFLSTFAGIGGFDLALERVGFRCVGQVEIDRGCRAILARRFPDARRWRDVRRLKATQVRRALDVRGVRSGLVGRAADDASGRGGESPIETKHLDLLVGGFPCQDLSVAGKRTGLSGRRSSLFHELVRIATIARPTWGLFENVPGLLSSDSGRDMWTVLQGLRQCWPHVGYRILDSRYFGVAQRRRRVFFVGGPSEAGVARVLALLDGGDGDPETSGEAGARASGEIKVGVDLARALGGIGGGQDYGANTLVARTLTGGAGGSASHGKPSGSDRREMVVSDPVSQEGRVYTHEGSHNVQVNDRPGPLRRQDLARAVVFTERTRADGRNLETQADLAYSLNNPGDGGRTQENNVAVFRKAQKAHSPDDCERSEEDDEIDTLAGHGTTSASAVTSSSSAVRRLTPVECERLQGFPDGWTCLCQTLEAYAADPDGAALRCSCTDSARYRALGNAVTVNVVEWIGHQLKGQL